MAFAVMNDTNSIVERISNYSIINTEISVKCRSELATSLSWIGFFHNVEKANASIILDAAYSSAVEAVSLVSLGLLRAAVFALRNHYELMLMYSYMKDHPIETSSALAGRIDLPLPGFVKKYMAENFENYPLRMNLLNKHRTREKENYYDVLSSVVHGSAIISLPTANMPSDIVQNIQDITSPENVFLGASEQVSDIFVSQFNKNWLSLPSLVRTSLKQRLGDHAKSMLHFS